MPRSSCLDTTAHEGRSNAVGATAVIDALHFGLAVLDGQAFILFANPAFLSLTGLEQAQGLHLCDALFPGSGLQEDLASPRHGQCLDILLAVPGRDPIRARLTIAHLADAGAEAYLAILEDVTQDHSAQDRLADLEGQVERRTAHLLAVNAKLKAEIAERKIAVAAMAKAEQKYRSIFENAIEGIYQSTPEGRFINANPALARIFGYDSPEQLIREISDAAATYADSDRRTEFMRLLHKDGMVTGLESQIRRRDGALIWISENARTVRDKDGNIAFYEGTLVDVTERRQAQDELARRSLHDTLTGLANKALFTDRLTQVMTRARRGKDFRYAVLFLDLDRFKVVNESLGHSRGDKLLRNIARKLTLELRGNDSVARFGGDEFAVLLDDLTAPRQAIAVAKRIREALAEPVTIEEHEVFTSASIGVVLGSEHDTSAEQILRDADIAMNRAKKAGKSQFKIFSSQMHAQAMRLLNLEGDLRRALDRGEFMLHYQPIVSLADGRLTGFEALVRWLHPSRGLIPPMDFISLAEETGLILPLGAWVLDHACTQLAQWHERNPQRGLTMSVNLSAAQINHANLVEQVDRALRKTGLPPQSLKLEITESVVMQNAEAASSLLKQLRDLSVRLSIDDFGTGYSSLSYLNRFPVDQLKIDRSFVSGMADQQENLGIVQSVVSLAHALGMDVVAEGVETAEQMDSLKGLECEFAQGYLFSRPVDVGNASHLLDTYAAW